MRCLCLLLLFLPGCADWPDAGGGPTTFNSGPWPTLMPVSDLLGTVPAAKNDDAERLAARASRLRARAAILRRNLANRDEIEALRARLRP